MAQVSIVELPGVRLPKDGTLLRDYTRETPSPDYIKRYDRWTVLYDAQWRDDLDAYVVTAPLFLNLWDTFVSGLTPPNSGASTVQIKKRTTWKRSERLVIRAPREGFRLNMGEQSFRVPTRLSVKDRFKGLRCAVTLNKNNHLDWIRDWAVYHVNAHGLEAVAIADNGSTDYPLEDVAATLESVPGLKQAVIYSADFPYGPAGGGKIQPKFFQSAMLNLMRDDAMAHARSVLNCDIDEMVIGPKGNSIFEATEAHPLGMITFLGYWAYPETMDAGPQAQAQHRYRMGPHKKVNRKWCLVPHKFIGRNWLWDVHQTGGVFQNAFTTSKVYHHAHCRACSTGWRAGRFDFDLSEVRFDPELDALFREHLPSGT